MRIRLVASLCVAPLERHRYLVTCVEALSEFCDAVRVWADGSPEIVRETLRGLPADVEGSFNTHFWQHEGHTRQAAYEWALRAEPTHVLAIDADEFVADGAALRAAIGRRTSVLGLCMQEVWAATPEQLTIRMDGGWNPHPVPILWAPRPGWSIPAKQHASGRTPTDVIRFWNRWECPTEILHFGWTNLQERAQRYERYASQAGFGHAGSHIRSIMWPDRQITPCYQPWPEGIRPYAAKILATANPEVRDEGLPTLDPEASSGVPRSRDPG